MSTIDYAHECRKGKLLISIPDMHGDSMYRCAPIRFKFVNVPGSDDIVSAYAATYTYGLLCDICPVFAADDELYGLLSKRPKIRVYESHVYIRWVYRGINIAYKIKLELFPVDSDDTNDSDSDLIDRIMAAELESAQLRIKLDVVTDQLKTALDRMSQMDVRLAAVENRVDRT